MSAQPTLIDPTSALMGCLFQAQTLTSQIGEALNLAKQQTPGQAVEDLIPVIYGLKELHKELEATKGKVGGALDLLQASTAIQMGRLESPTVRTQNFTATPQIRSFYSVKDPIAFYNWLVARSPDEPRRATVQFHSCVSGVEAMRDLCDGLLKDGGELPPGVSSYLKPTVSIRRR